MDFNAASEDAAMSTSFLDHVRDIEDGRIAGMTTYPLDEVLLTVLVGLLCKMDDIEEISVFCEEQIDWLRRYLPFENGVAPARTLRRALRALDPGALAGAFSSWVASLRATLSDRPAGVVAIDGKTLRGSKRDRSGSGALHVVSAYAHEAGLVLAARAVETKGNEITAIPELLDMLALEGAIVTIDAMGTQKAIAEKIVGGRETISSPARKISPPFTPMSKSFSLSGAARRARNIVKPTPGMVGSRSAAPASPTPIGSQNAIRTGRIAVDRGDRLFATGQENRRDFEGNAVLHLVPAAHLPRIPAASRAHWSIENNLHWTLDVAFREDECRTRKNYSALNLAVIRHAALNILKREATKIPLKRKRVKAAANPDFRAVLLKC